jgi:hypothetical protein
MPPNREKTLFVKKSLLIIPKKARITTKIIKTDVIFTTLEENLFEIKKYPRRINEKTTNHERVADMITDKYDALMMK